MIYRFDILAPDGLYDGWAHNPDEMGGKFMAMYPDASGKGTPYVFSSGSAPRWLDYDEYKQLREVEELSDAAIRILDNRLCELWENIEARVIEEMIKRTTESKGE